jgi:Arc/MetJ-type ribon-helix-helix transcriptional regulator
MPVVDRLIRALNYDSRSSFVREAVFCVLRSEVDFIVKRPVDEGSIFHDQ